MWKGEEKGEVMWHQQRHFEQFLGFSEANFESERSLLTSWVLPSPSKSSTTSPKKVKMRILGGDRLGYKPYCCSGLLHGPNQAKLPRYREDR